MRAHTRKPNNFHTIYPTAKLSFRFLIYALVIPSEESWQAPWGRDIHRLALVFLFFGFLDFYMYGIAQDLTWRVPCLFTNVDYPFLVLFYCFLVLLFSALYLYTPLLEMSSCDFLFLQIQSDICRSCHDFHVFPI